MSFIKTNYTLKNKDFTNSTHTKLLNRHRWYYIKESFSPLIVKEAIQSVKLNKNDIVLDPFVGCGTVNLVANQLGINSIGVEVNPFMHFIALTKHTNIRKSSITKYKDNIIKAIKKGKKSALEKHSTFTENVKNIKWLFNRSVLRAFEGGFDQTNYFPYQIKNIYKLTLIKAVMENSNAYKDGKCLRYKKNWDALNYNKNTFLKTFIKNIKEIEDDLENNPIVPHKSNIYLGDSRVFFQRNTLKKFRLCITSPPYLNSFDYTDIYRPELFLGKFIASNKELYSLRFKTLRSHVQVKWNKPIKKNFGILFTDVFKKIDNRKEMLWNKQILQMVQAYFEDMEDIIINLKKLAKKDAQLWIIVSTSAYAGVEIPVDLILADIGSKNGWNLEKILTIRNLRNSSQNAKKWQTGEYNSKRLRESVVIFRNN